MHYLCVLLLVPGNFAGNTNNTQHWWRVSVLLRGQWSINIPSSLRAVNASSFLSSCSVNRDAASKPSSASANFSYSFKKQNHYLYTVYMYLNPTRNITVYYEIYGEDHKIFTFVEPSSVCSELICFLSAAISFWFFSTSSESWPSFSTKFHDIPYVKIDHTQEQHITSHSRLIIQYLPSLLAKGFRPIPLSFKEEHKGPKTLG